MDQSAQLFDIGPWTRLSPVQEHDEYDSEDGLPSLQDIIRGEIRR